MALCQDCCRLHPTIALIPSDNETPGLCPDCWGSCCDCDACIASVKHLAAGNWNKSQLQPEFVRRAISWTPTGGLVCAGELDDITTIAINLARNCGFAVFPCLASKKPASSHGFKDACTDPAAIAGRWRHWPGPLIGIATGEASGIDLLDVDCGDWPADAKPDFIAKHDFARAWWRANQHRIPPTRTYRSQSGGLHLHYLHAGGVVNTASKIADGIDTRGTGGYAIAWFAAGAECLDHTPPALWPGWLLAEAVAPAPAPMPRPLQTTRRRVARGGTAAVAGILRRVATARQGERNAILHWAACRLGERVRVGTLTSASVAAQLIAAAMQSGLTEREANATIRSGLSRTTA